MLALRPDRGARSFGMRVLVFSQHFWPESFAINRVVASLRQQGCELTVLTGQPNYPEGHVFDGYRAWGLGCESGPDCEILRVPLIPRRTGGALRLVMNYVSFIASASLFGPWLLRGRRFDVIFVYGTSPILQALAALAIAKLKGAALVIWVQDLWPESLSLTGYVRNPRLLALVGCVVSFIYRRSNLLLAQSRGFVAPIRELAGGTPIEVHPNPGRVPDGASASPALRLQPGFNIVFAGNLGTVQALPTVLAAARLLGPGSGIRWVLIGSGTCSEWLAEQVQAQGLRETVQLPGRFAPTDMTDIYAQADALLVSLNRGEALSRTVPSKLQDYLSAGRPVLASLDGEGAAWVREAGAGLACPAEDAEALAAAALKLRDMDAASRARMGEAARRCFEQQFAPEMLARRLVAHFESALQYRRGGQSGE